MIVITLDDIFTIIAIIILTIILIMVKKENKWKNIR